MFYWYQTITPVLAISLLWCIPTRAVDSRCAIVTIEGICGTTEYGHHLGEAFRRRGVTIDYYHYEKLFTSRPRSFVKECVDNKISCVFFQHYFAFWQDSLWKQQWLRNFTMKAKKHGIKVVATVHEDFQPSKIESSFIRSLSSGIIHRETYQFPYLNSLHLVAHPVPVYDISCANKNELRSKYGFNNTDRIITTTGFLNTRKATPEIIEVLIEHLLKDKNLRLQILCAAVVGGQFSIADHIKHIIQNSGCSEQIYFDCNFLPQQEINERLFMSDLGFTWNSINQNSGSGIEKQFVSSRLPYVVNNCLHFDAVPGSLSIATDIRLLAQTLATLVYQDDKLATMHDALSQQYDKLNYDAMVEIYAKIFGIGLS